MEMAFKSIDTKTIKAPEGEGCPRCGGCVFAAEMMLSKGQVCLTHYHIVKTSCHFLLSKSKQIRNGISCALIVLIAIGHWTRCWPAMAPTRISTARPATVSDSDRKASATVTHQLWYALRELLTCPSRPSKASRLPKAKAALVAASSSMLLSR